MSAFPPVFVGIAEISRIMSHRIVTTPAARSRPFAGRCPSRTIVLRLRGDAVAVARTDAYDVPKCFHSSTHPSCRGCGREQDAFDFLLRHAQQRVELAYPALRDPHHVLHAGIDVCHGAVDQIHVAAHGLSHGREVAGQSGQFA